MPVQGGSDAEASGSGQGGSGQSGSGQGGSGQGGVDQGGAGEGGASGRDWYVDPLLGSDANSGTLRSPFQTLTHAAQTATAPGTIWLVQGTFDAALEPRLDLVPEEALDSVCGVQSGILIPNGVDVRGLAQPPVLVSVRGRHGLCARSSDFSSIAFQRETFEGALLEFDGGSAQLRGVSFENFDGPIGPEMHGPIPSLNLRGQSALDWLAEPVGQTLGHGAFARLKDEARLRIVGGQSRFFPDNGVGGQVLFHLEGAASLELSGVTLLGEQDRGHTAVLAYSADPAAPPTVSFTDHTLVSGFSIGCRFARSARVSVADSEFNAQSTVSLAGIPIGFQDHASLQIDRSALRNSDVGVFLTGENVNVGITDSLIEGNGTGISAAAANLSLADTRIVDNSRFGITAASPSIVMRRTSIERNGGGLSLTGRVSLADLGRADDPGQNRFTGNGHAGELLGANLSSSCNNGCFVYASGNIWDPLEQGADADGRYRAPSGDPWDVTSGSGANYVVNSGTLRLAE